MKIMLIFILGSMVFLPNFASAKELNKQQDQVATMHQNIHTKEMKDSTATHQMKRDNFKEENSGKKCTIADKLQKKEEQIATINNIIQQLEKHKEELIKDKKFLIKKMKKNKEFKNTKDVKEVKDIKTTQEVKDLKK